ncbi:hypothetical protein [Streptomyces sp. NPDC060198]|uniref:hypothetical protein n=1 Tax=Streptomyces sp. NPDC060198 TaxID=3347070 RepID=UPI0036589EE5
MSAYSRIYRNLTAGGMPADQAAAELADLRRELGQELATGLLQHIKEVCRYSPRDTHGRRRVLDRQYGAMHRALDWIVAATATGRLTTTPQQRTRSNP